MIRGRIPVVWRARRSEAAVARPRRWLWGAAALLLIAPLLSAPLLHGLAWMLIAEDGAPTAEDVLVLKRDHCFDHACALYRTQRASRFHYVEQPTNRLVQLGITPAWGNVCMQELARRGIPPHAISSICGAANEPWGTARILRTWLQHHPHATVLVLCRRFESGATRYAFSSVLDDAEFNRVGFWCPPDARFDETNWWRSDAGRREFTAALFTQVYFRLHGEDAGPPATAFDPSAYERGLK